MIIAMQINFSMIRKKAPIFREMFDEYNIQFRN
jgi:hypothetical protein